MRWVVIALAGCAFQRGAPPAASGDSGSGSGDGSSVYLDAAIDVPPGTPCYGAPPVQVCLMTAPTQMKTAGNGLEVDTDMDTDCEPDANVLLPADHSLCVLASTGYSVTGNHTLGAQGNRPLVIVSAGDITIAGLVDVASHIGSPTQPVGAGANRTTCSAGSGPQGVGGAAGGTSNGSGGIGGRGFVLGVGGPNGGGTPGMMTSSATQFLGGCRGQIGGNGGGGGGDGGGAVALIANGMIKIDGLVDASGGGGHKGQSNTGYRGGGGGGAGGMIVIIAATLTGGGGGRIFAAGGGGGGGAVTGMDGKDGADPAGGMLANAAAGGSGGGSSGDGGTGSKTGSTGGTNGGSANVNGGGGGGGGGAGVIVIQAASNQFGGMQSP